MKLKLNILLFTLSILSFAQETVEVEYDRYRLFDAEKVKDQKVTINDVDLNEQQLIKYFQDEMAKAKPYLLVTDKRASIYIEKPILNGASSMSIFDDTGNGVYYKDLVNNYYMHESVGFGYDQIIKDSIQKIDWQLTREKKTILGFEVRKATAVVNGDRNVIAWYATKIPFSSGPDIFVGLPGLILELEYYFNNEINLRVKYLAVNIKELKNNKQIKKPSKGEIVNLETYKSNMKKYWERMEEMNPEGVDTN